MAEVYWDLEWTLQQQGFDYTYDKRLYDRLRDGRARPVREHLQAELDYQIKLARFLENHDEPRAAAAFDPDGHRAAAVIAYSVPGLRFFHQGQLQGRKKRISPHLVRAPQEPPDRELEAFYDQLKRVAAITLTPNSWMHLRPSPMTFTIATPVATAVACGRSSLQRLKNTSRQEWKGSATARMEPEAAKPQAVET